MRIRDWSSDVCSSDLLPERQVILDEQGGIAEIRVRDRLDSMRLIEDYMIAANVAAAKALEAKKSPVMYRINEPPSCEKLVSPTAYIETFHQSLALGQVIAHLGRVSSRGRMCKDV